MESPHLILWIGFAVVVAVLLGLDLFVVNRSAHQARMREALLWSVVWVGVALLFNLAVAWMLGYEPAMQFLTGYLVEKSLSVDNLFIFITLFRYFGVEPRYQHRVMFWGVLGAIVLRLIMIVAGVALVQRFHWLLYVFGAFLILTGVKLAFQKEKPTDLASNPAVRLARRFFHFSDRFHGQRFFVKENGRRVATPLLLVLITIELSDVMFALDSIPAIFGITQDVFIIVTSNIFAILGLRSLYFVLAGFMDRFVYLSLGLALVLTFIGGKMLAAAWWPPLSTGLSLGVVGGILALAVFASLIRGGVKAGSQP